MAESVDFHLKLWIGNQTILLASASAENERLHEKVAEQQAQIATLTAEVAALAASTANRRRGKV